MASTIVAPQVDIVELILQALQMPEETEKFDEACKAIDDRITRQQPDALQDGAMQMLWHAQKTAFRLGWEMRGQV